MMNNPIGFIVAILVASVLFMGGMVIAFQQCALWSDRVPVRVFVDGKDVYHGISACVNVNSSGAHTTVQVNSSFMCLFPSAYYVSKDVKVVNE